jgi:hypothetical protein
MLLELSLRIGSAGDRCFALTVSVPLNTVETEHVRATSQSSSTAFASTMHNHVAYLA